MEFSINYVFHLRMLVSFSYGSLLVAERSQNGKGLKNLASLKHLFKIYFRNQTGIEWKVRMNIAFSIVRQLSECTLISTKQEENFKSFTLI